MTLPSKTLLPAQEAKITQNLGFAATLDHAAFAKRSLTHGLFGKWFRERYHTEPTAENITPEIRAAFMLAWEAKQRAGYILENKRAEDDAAELAEHEAAEHEAAERERARRDRESEDETPSRDDDDDDGGEESEDPDPAMYDAPATEPYPGDDDPGVILLGQWYVKFRTLSPHAQEEWRRTHIKRLAWVGGINFHMPIYFEPNGEVVPDILADFESYTETVRRSIGRKANRLKGRGLSDVAGDPLYLVPNVIPLSGATLFHGHRKHAKSSYAHKLVACITSDALTFDGVAVPHGPVLYVSADSAARLAEMSARLSKVCRRLGVPLPNVDRLSVVDSPLNLTDPAEVDQFIKDNPGPWVLVIIDPLYRCVGGRDLLGVGVANDLDNGCARIGDEFGCPVLILHHDTKDGKTSYGTGFIEAGGASAVQFERHSKGGVLRDLDPVTVTVQWLKNGPNVAEPFAYRIEGAYLAAKSEPVGALAPARGSIKRADVLDALPTVWTLIKGLRTSINGKLAPGAKPLDEKTWQRLRTEWESAGRIEQKDGRIRRVVTPM